ncbi:MAG: ROK family protein [Firmicutes bacterium]|nr:ROK family protein [Bacillota bacterium]
MNFIGIDIGGTNVKLALVDSNGKILKKSVIKTGDARDFAAVIDNIAQEVSRLAFNQPYEAIGAGCPGAINSAAGIVEYSPNLYWKNVPLARLLSQKTNKETRITNDANAAALGEHRFGAGKNYTDTALITLGTGVGGGFVVDGKLFEGYGSMGTEIGHTVITQNGEPCACGRRGCFETYASATALIRETKKMMESHRASAMWSYTGGSIFKADGRTAFECAKQGDAAAQRVVDAYIRALAEGLLNVVAIFRSQAIILGGGVCAQGAYLTNPVQEYVDAYRYGGADSLRTVILTAELGNDAGVIGAACLGGGI